MDIRVPRHPAGRPAYLLFVVALTLVTSVSAVSAQTEKAERGPALRAGGASGGVRTYRPGRWGVVTVEVVNPTDEPKTIEVAFHFDPEPEVDFGKQFSTEGELVARQRASQGTLAPQYKFTRRLWLPPQTRRMAHCPIVPPDVQASGAYNAICTATDVTSGQPRAMPDASGQLQRSAILSIPVDRLVSAAFSDWRAESEARHEGAAYAALVASRLTAGHTRRIALVDQYTLPARAEDFAAIDHLLVDNLAPLHDAATLAAVQRWLLDGGRMWVMLDAVGVEAATKLLGNAFHCAEVGRVDLSEVSFQSEGSGATSDTVEYENPIPMVRVVVDSARVLYRVEGWPAAFVQDFGKGRVVFTTINPRALLRPPSPQDQMPDNPDYQANLLARSELVELSGLLYGTMPESPLEPEELRPFLAQQIGWRIVSRTPILIILISFVGALAVAGVVTTRSGKTGRLAWIAPGIALLATLPIAGLGMTTQKSIPNTVAVGQVLPIEPGTEEINVRGTLAFYHQSPSELDAASEQGGWFLPDVPTNDQTVHEIVWDDYDRWDWRNFRVPPSVVAGPFWRATRYPGEPCRLEATFNEEGLVGRVIGGGWESFEDPLVVVPSNRGLAVTMAEDGQFVGSPDRILAPGQFVGADILGDKQRRRQELLRDMFSRAGARQFPTVPSLLFWTRPLPLPFQYDEDIQVTGDALAYGPIELQRPAAGTRVTIPHSFLPLKPVAGPGSRGVASSYQASTGEFARMRAASDTWLRAQLPPVLMPMTIDRLQIRLQINAPSRTLTIAAAQNDQLVAVREIRNPSGEITATIEGAELLQLDATGGLRLGLLVGDSQASGDQSPEWKIDDLQITAAGQVP